MDKIKILFDTLQRMGYEPKITKEDKYTTISFRSLSSENITNGQQKVIEAILGDKLMEFYYESNKQYIFIWNDK